MQPRPSATSCGDGLNDKRRQPRDPRRDRLEQTLIDGGYATTVAASRRDLSLAITDELRRVIEQHTGRRVTAHLPMSDPATGTCADVFILTD